MADIGGPAAPPIYYRERARRLNVVYRTRKLLHRENSKLTELSFDSRPIQLCGESFAGSGILSTDVGGSGRDRENKRIVGASDPNG